MTFPVTENIARTARHTSFYLACGPDDGTPLICARPSRMSRQARCNRARGSPSSPTHFFHIVFPLIAFAVFGAFVVRDIRAHGRPASSWRLQPAPSSARAPRSTAGD